MMLKQVQTVPAAVAPAPARSIHRGIIRATIASFAVLTVLTGVVYPLVVTVIARLAFPVQAEGSLIDRNGQFTNDANVAIGSRLIGQNFDQPQYFWPRPSATSPMPYNAGASSGSNIGPSAIAPVVEGRIDALHRADPGQSAPIPIDLVTASASGLDPQESIAAALFQVPRIARTRGISTEQVVTLVNTHTAPPVFGMLGEESVNVLELNLALDKLAPATDRAAPIMK